MLAWETSVRLVFHNLIWRHSFFKEEKSRDSITVRIQGWSGKRAWTFAKPLGKKVFRFFLSNGQFQTFPCQHINQMAQHVLSNMNNIWTQGTWSGITEVVSIFKNRQSLQTRYMPTLLLIYLTNWEKILCFAVECNKILVFNICSVSWI